MDSDALIPRLQACFAAAAPPGVAAAYLFGSHGQDRSHRDSDVDVGVLLDRALYPDRASRFDARVRLGSVLVDALDRNDVDVVILNDAPPELGRAIVVRGRRVHCADAEADHAYVRDVQLRAADLDIFLRRVRRTKLKALRR